MDVPLVGGDVISVYFPSVDTPPPQSWTFLGSAVLAVKLSTVSVANCCFFVGWDQPSPIDHLAPRLGAPFFSFPN